MVRLITIAAVLFYMQQVAPFNATIGFGSFIYGKFSYIVSAKELMRAHKYKTGNTFLRANFDSKTYKFDLDNSGRSPQYITFRIQNPFAHLNFSEIKKEDIDDTNGSLTDITKIGVRGTIFGSVEFDFLDQWNGNDDFKSGIRFTFIAAVGDSCEGRLFINLSQNNRQADFQKFVAIGKSGYEKKKHYRKSSSEMIPAGEVANIAIEPNYLLGIQFSTRYYISHYLQFSLAVGIGLDYSKVTIWSLEYGRDSTRTTIVHDVNFLELPSSVGIIWTMGIAWMFSTRVGLYVNLTGYIPISSFNKHGVGSKNSPGDLDKASFPVETTSSTDIRVVNFSIGLAFSNDAYLM